MSIQDRPQVVLVLDDPSALVRSLEATGRYRVTVCANVAELTPSDVILIGLPQFTALRENDPMVYLRLSRHSRLVVLLHSHNLLDAIHVLAFADAWVFEDLNADRINELLDLAREGHCPVPKPFLSRLGVDEIRRTLLPRLSDREVEALRLLGQGVDNRTLADRLNLSEAAAKAMVRSVLAKLHFRNRTEAGVFAARHAA